MSTFTVSRIHHASVIVADVKKALAFYQTILGLALDPSRPDLDFPGAWLKIADQQIHLLELPNPDAHVERPAHGGKDRHLALSVTDVAALQNRLEQNSIAFTLSQSGRKALFCKDPDGNALEFIETGVG